MNEVSLQRMMRYAVYEFILTFIYPLCFVSPLRVLFLKCLGAKIGGGTVIHKAKFVNFYKHGFKTLNIGRDCFIGYGVTFDLSNYIVIRNNVTISDEVMILTHINVGGKEHYLQKYFPKSSQSVMIQDASFIGAKTVIIHGVDIGTQSAVGAMSLVKENVKDNTLVAGIPAKFIRQLKVVDIWMPNQLRNEYRQKESN